MKSRPGVWGIDLGQCALKAVRLQEINGQLTATAFDYVEYPKILSQPEAEPDQLIREALEKFLSHNSLRGDTVCISVPGQSGLTRFIKLPPVEEQKINDIIRFEARQQIPFDLNEVIWDFQKIGSGTVTDGLALDTEIGLFAMKRDVVSRYLEHFKDVKVEIHLIQMAPLALCNYAAFDLLQKELAAAAPPAEGEPPPEEESGCVCVLDLGTDSSNLVITDGKQILWQRPIPIGGNHFTRALARELKLTFAKAEHLKRNAAKAPDLKQILSALKPVLNDFVNEVQRSLGYFSTSRRDAQVDYVIGLGNAFQLPGLQRFLEEKLQLSVRKLDKMEKLTGETVLTAQAWTENISTFGVAYGLALQGMKRAWLQTNLLPCEIRTERLIRAKKPAAVASAAALLIGLVSLMTNAGLSYRAYAHPDVILAEKKAEAIEKKAKAADSEFKKARLAAVNEQSSIHSLFSGQGEFRNWMALMRFISDAIPRPDGSNLPPDPRIRDVYWKNRYTMKKSGEKRLGAMSGKEAFEEFKERQEGQYRASTPSPDGPGARSGQLLSKSALEELGPGIDNLIQVNIEAIDSRFFEDVRVFWSRALIDPGNVFPDVNARTAPTGRAWVVEIRGYTFHFRERNFLLDTFVSNLVRKAEIGPLGSGTPSAAPAGPKAGPGTPPGKAPASGAAPGKDPGKAPASGAAPARDPVRSPETDLQLNVPLEMRPVIGNITHVVLFKDRAVQRSDARNFALIGSSIFDLVGQANSGSVMVGSPVPAKPGTGAKPGSTPQGKPGPQASTPPTPQVEIGPTGRDTWKPIALGGAGRRPAAPMGIGFRAPPQPGTPSVSDGPSHVRTEFVILFVWKEPILNHLDAPKITKKEKDTASSNKPVKRKGDTWPKRRRDRRRRKRAPAPAGATGRDPEEAIVPASPGSGSPGLLATS